MSIWFFLWLILSAFLLYFLGWTVYILFRQKQAWQTYAKNKNLRFKATRFFSSPEVMGTVDGYTVHLLTGEHTSADGRNVRKLTAIEIHMGSKMPMEGVVASGGMVDIAQGMALKEEYRPDYEGWSKDYLAASSSLPAMKTYLTPPRVEALASLMKIKSGWVILVFRGDLTFLRLDTPSALQDAKKIDALVSKMIRTARVLELNPGEDQLLRNEAAKTTKEKTVMVSKAAAAGIGLQLEEDYGESPPESE